MLLSEIRNFILSRPRPRKYRKTVANFHCLPYSLRPLRRISRYPALFTPTATRTDTFCTSPPQERFKAGSHLRKHMDIRFQAGVDAMSRCVLKNFLIQVTYCGWAYAVTHNASVISSTRRTDTPARYISTKASSAELSRLR